MKEEWNHRQGDEYEDQKDEKRKEDGKNRRMEYDEEQGEVKIAKRFFLNFNQLDVEMFQFINRTLCKKITDF